MADLENITPVAVESVTTDNETTQDANADRPKDKIQISSGRPSSTYVRLATRFLQTEKEIELSGLGQAIGSTVTVAEILKNRGYCDVTKIETAIIGLEGRAGARPTNKVKISIKIVKSKNFDDLVAADSVLEAAGISSLE